MNKDITVTFVSYFSEKKILNYIKKLNNKFKIIIIENSNNQKLKKKLKKFKNIKVILNKNTGFGAGINLAIKNANTKYTLHLDIDTEIEIKSITKLVNFANKYKDFGILSAKIKNYKYQNDHFLKKNIYKNCHQMKFVDGCCMLFNIKRFKKIGFFDENYFLYFEESDLFKKCEKYKKKIFMIDNIFINHKGRSSSESVHNAQIEINRNWHYMWSKFYFNNKHYGYLFAIFNSGRNLISAITKFLFYSLIKNKKRKQIYFARYQGCINSMLLKKSWYRPNINPSTK